MSKATYEVRAKLDDKKVNVELASRKVALTVKEALVNAGFEVSVKMTKDVE